MPSIISVEVIVSKIFEIRGKKVMLDSDLAKLYGVETKYLIRQVKRNSARFPGDFMYLLSPEEVRNLRCQNVTSSWGGRRYLPYAFTKERSDWVSYLIPLLIFSLYQIASGLSCFNSIPFPLSLRCMV